VQASRLELRSDSLSLESRGKVGMHVAAPVLRNNDLIEDESQFAPKIDIEWLVKLNEHGS
jgi:hypothetical protein